MPFGGLELLILLAIILMFFGAKRIPELARSLGKGSREFRKGLEEEAEAEELDRAQRQDPGKVVVRERREKESSQQEDARPEDQNTRAEPNSKA